MNLPNNIPIPFIIQLVAIPDSNFRKGRIKPPDLIVIHIAEGSKQSVISTFQDSSVQKSSHFLICKDGSILQFVSTNDTAYGNGIVTNPVSEIVLSRLPENPNEYSISIEHEGFSTSDITLAQYTTTPKLIKYLHDKWAIPLNRTHIIRHQEIESIKTCPGLVSVEKLIQSAKLL